MTTLQDVKNTAEQGFYNIDGHSQFNDLIRAIKSYREEHPNDSIEPVAQQIRNAYLQVLNDQYSNTSLRRPYEHRGLPNSNAFAWFVVDVVEDKFADVNTTRALIDSIVNTPAARLQDKAQYTLAEPVMLAQESNPQAQQPKQPKQPQQPQPAPIIFTPVHDSIRDFRKTADQVEGTVRDIENALVDAAKSGAKSADQLTKSVAEVGDSITNLLTVLNVAANNITTALTPSAQDSATQDEASEQPRSIKAYRR